MRTVCDDSNKVEDVFLNTTIKEVYDSTSQSSPFYEYHRFAQKSYSYVGLTEAAAKEWRQIKLDKYCRTFYDWKWENGKFVKDPSSAYKSYCATVVPRRVDGAMCTLEINVDEESIVYSPRRLSNVEAEALFVQSYGTFDYDE